MNSRAIARAVAINSSGGNHAADQPTVERLVEPETPAPRNTTRAPARCRRCAAGTSSTPPPARCRAGRTRSRSAPRSTAMRTSIGSSMVTPMPTAGPFTAAITGLRQLKMRSVMRPPPSRAESCERSGLPSGPFGTGGRSRRASRSNVPPPVERSAPAQNALPAPVTMIARTASSASAASNASIRSRIICVFSALSLSGRLIVMVKMLSARSVRMVSYGIGLSGCGGE